MSSRPRRTVRRAFVAAVAIVAVTASGAAGQVPSRLPSQDALEAARREAESLRDEAAEAERELARVEARVTELEAEQREAEAVLQQVTAEYEQADAEAVAASDRADHVRDQLTATRAEQAEVGEQLTGIARDTYKYGLPASSPMMAVMDSIPTDTGGGLADRVHYLQRGMDDGAVTLERASALSIEVAHLSERADQQSAEAEAAREVAEGLRDEAAAAHAELEALVAEVSMQLDRSVELVAQLETQRAAAQQQVATLEQQVENERAEAQRREQERRDREARERREREREQQRQQQRERQRRAAASTTASASSSSSSSGSARSSGGGGGSTTVVSSGSGLVTVGGITVSSSIGSNLKALLDHARRDGIILGGSGYRSPEITARLRVTNGCPDVYDSPASSCRVPTARPGSSEHEKGLAVDFTWNGQTICYPRSASQCSGNAAFNWLRANAGRYGFKNLPSEAWHWSTTGR